MQAQDLFGNHQLSQDLALQQLQQKALQKVSGLSLVNNFIDYHLQQKLIKQIYLEPWNDDISRRTQFYGNSYSQQNQTPLPRWSIGLQQRIYQQFGVGINQLSVNEYLPGQGIAPHVDKFSGKGEITFNLSLSVTAQPALYAMEFHHKLTSQVVIMPLPPLSLQVMQNQARYHWRHGISKRLSDIYYSNDGQSFSHPRYHRVSINMRYRPAKNNNA